MTIDHVELLSVDDLVEYPGNARRGDLDLIAESIKRNGFYGVVVRQKSTGYVLVGNHRFKAAKLAGLDSVPVQTVDVDDSTARRINLVDNRSNEVAGFDPVSLAELLELAADDGGLAGTGFTVDDFAELVDSLPSPTAGDVSDDETDDLDTGDVEPTGVYSADDLVNASVAHWRQRGFPYRDVSIPHGMQMINRLHAAPDALLINSLVGYQLADTYHPHRFAVKIEGKRPPTESFASDKYLGRSIRLMIDKRAQLTDAALNNTLAVVAGSQAASNFRPGFALHLYRRYGHPGATVLDTSTGFGGRLVGFFASECDHYIGVDPNTVTHEANLRMATDLGQRQRVELINLPAEDVPHSAVAERCDFAFTSPPYFSKEHYSNDDTQSWKRYSDGDGWRVGFLQAMLALQFAALKPGSVNIVNIADVKIGSATYPLLDWTVEDAELAGFDVLNVEKFPMSRIPGAGEQQARYEPVVVMRKPD